MIKFILQALGITPKGDPKWVIWYITPSAWNARKWAMSKGIASSMRMSPKDKTYLSLIPGSAGGGVYVHDIKLATEFDSEEEALSRISSYDGSSDIVRRTGVQRVWR